MKPSFPRRGQRSFKPLPEERALKPVKWLARAVVALPLLALAIGCILYLVALGRFLSQHLAPIVAAAAESTLSRQVRVGRVVAFSAPGKVLLTDVAISNLATFAADRERAIRTHDPSKGLPALVADRVMVDYDLRSLLFNPTNATAALSDVTIDKPAVYIERLTPGKFNFTPLFQRKPRPNAKPFKGRILVNDGTVTFFDDTAPRSIQPAVNVFHDFSGTADFRSDNAIYYAAQGVGEAGRLGAVGLSGDVLRNDTPKARATGAQGYRLRLQAQSANAAYLGRYFLSSTAKVGRVAGGVASADVTISKIGRPPHAPLDITGSVDIAGGRLIVTDRRMVDRPFDNIQGRFFFTGNGATIDAAGSINRMPIAVSGAVFDFHHPQIALTTHAPHVGFASLRDAFPFIPALPAGVDVAGSGALDLSFAGAASSPVIQGRASLPVADIDGNRLVHLQSQATFAGHLLTIKTLTAQALSGGGTVEAQGIVDTSARPATFLLSGTARGVNLAAVHLPTSAAARVGPLGGVGDTSFLATNRGKSGGVAPISLAADFSVLNASMRRVALGQVSGRVSWQEGASVGLRDFIVRQPDGGLLIANGTVPAGARSAGWSLTLSAARVRLQPLLAPFHVSGIGGVAYLRGRVSGVPAAPQLSGYVTVFAPHYGSFAADTLEAELAATPNGIRIEHGTINRFPATGTFSGTVTDLGANPRVALSVNISHEDLQDLVAMASRPTSRVRVSQSVAKTLPTVTGEASAQLAISGTLPAIRVNGMAKVANATVGAYRVDSAQAAIGFADGVVHVSDLAAVSEGAQFRGSGEYESGTQRIAAEFRGDGIDIARISRNLAPDIQATGALDIAGAVAGTLKNPIVTVNGVANNLVVDGISFSQCQAGVRYSDGTIQSTGAPIALTSQGTTYRITAFSYRPANKMLALDASVQDETFAHVAKIVESSELPPLPFVLKARAVLGNLPQPLAGSLAIPTLSVHGPLDNLAGSITANVSDIQVGTTKLTTMAADLTYANHTIDIRQLQARGDAAYLDVTGTVNLQGDVAAKLEASNISLTDFNQFLPRSVHLGGVISDFTLVASGPTGAPDLEASVTLDKPSYNQFSLDRIDSGRITLANKQITVSDVSLTKTEKLPGGKQVDHVASISGTVPFTWQTGQFLVGNFPRNGPVALHAEVPLQSLSVLSLFFPSLPAQDFAGSIEAHVDLGGTMEHRSVTGAVMLQNGTMHLPALKTGLTKLNANIAFAGSRATIEQFSAQSDAGGSVSATGAATFGPPEAEGGGLAQEFLGGIALDLTAVAKNFTLDEPRITALYNAGFHGRMNGSLHVSRSLLRPLIEGSINVADTVGSLPTEPETVQPAPPPVFDPSFAVSVALARGSSLRSPQLNAQGEGNMTIQGSLDRPDVRGVFTLSGGRFSFPTAVFTIVPGGTVDLVYNPPDEIAERVYITATTSIDIAQATLASNAPATGVEMPASYAPAQLQPTTAGHYLITVTIQGLLNVPNQLQLSFTSNPPGLLPQQIYAALGGQQALNNLAGGNVQLAFQQEASQIFTSYAVPTLLSPVETGIAQTFGLEAFSIDYSPLYPVAVTLTKKIGPRENLTYMQLVTARQPGVASSTVVPPQYQLKLEYNLTSQLGLYVSTDNVQGNTLGVDGVFSFW